MNDRNVYYILKYAPDGNGIPFFFDTDWAPELPEFHYPSENPAGLCEHYEVSAKLKGLDADYLPDQFLASQRFVDICTEFGEKVISKKVSITGYRGKKIENYFFFVPAIRLSILDEAQSEFSLAKDKYTGGVAVSSEADGSFPVYEVIDKFKVSTGIQEDLFFCREIKEVVCSSRFQAAFVREGLQGIVFQPLDSFRYAPWEDF